MYPAGLEGRIPERNARLVAEAEQRRLAKLASGGPALWTQLRARTARKLAEVAVAADGKETRRVVWQWLRAPGSS